MPKVPCKDKDGNPLPELNLTQTLMNIVNATLKPGRMNPWTAASLPINGTNRLTYVKVINGVATEAQIAD